MQIRADLHCGIERSGTPSRYDQKLQMGYPKRRSAHGVPLSPLSVSLGRLRLVHSPPLSLLPARPRARPRQRSNNSNSNSRSSESNSKSIATARAAPIAAQSASSTRSTQSTGNVSPHILEAGQAQHKQKLISLRIRRVHAGLRKARSPGWMRVM